MLLNFCLSKSNKKKLSNILETLELTRTSESQYEQTKISLQEEVCEKFNGAEQYIRAVTYHQNLSSVIKLCG